MDRRKIDIALSAILIAAAVFILTNDNLASGGAESDLGTMFLPRFVAGLIIVFAATIAAQSLLGLSKGAKPEGPEIIVSGGYSGVFIYIGIFIAYWFSIPHVGFMIATPFVMIAVAMLLGGRSWIPIIATSVITTVIIYYGSREFLRVYLPTWTL